MKTLPTYQVWANGEVLEVSSGVGVPRHCSGLGTDEGKGERKDSSHNRPADPAASMLHQCQLQCTFVTP